MVAYVQKMSIPRLKHCAVEILCKLACVTAGHRSDRICSPTPPSQNTTWSVENIRKQSG